MLLACQSQRRKNVSGIAIASSAFTLVSPLEDCLASRRPSEPTLKKPGLTSPLRASWHYDYRLVRAFAVNPLRLRRNPSGRGGGDRSARLTAEDLKDLGIGITGACFYAGNCVIFALPML